MIYLYFYICFVINVLILFIRRIYDRNLCFYIINSYINIIKKIIKEIGFDWEDMIY